MCIIITYGSAPPEGIVGVGLLFSLFVFFGTSVLSVAESGGG